MTRSGRRWRAISPRKAVRLLVVVAWLGLLGTASITPAQADESCKSRKGDETSFLVPQDIIGEKWKVYCATGEVADVYDRRFGNDVNGGDSTWTRGQETIKDYAAKHLTLGGAGDFGSLSEEPCEVFHPDINKDEAHDVRFWLQCAKITGKDRGNRYNFPLSDYGYPHKDSPNPELAKRTETNYREYWQKHIRGAGVGVCQQWRNVFELLGKPEPPDLQQRINVCMRDGQNAVFQMTFDNPRLDTNVYDVKDYSGPAPMVDEINGLLEMGMWIGLFIAVLGVLTCAGSMAVAHSKGAEAVIGIKWVMAGSVIIVCSTGIGLLAVR